MNAAHMYKHGCGVSRWCRGKCPIAVLLGKVSLLPVSPVASGSFLAASCSGALKGKGRNIGEKRTGAGEGRKWGND